MNCQELERKLTDLAYGELAAAERAEVEAHVADCAGCARQLAEANAVRDLVSGLGAGAPAALSDDRRDALRRRAAPRGRGKILWLGAAAMAAGLAGILFVTTTHHGPMLAADSEAAAPMSPWGMNQASRYEEDSAGGVLAQHPGHNPVHDTRTERLSTFALDVDTGSYTLARSHLLAGHLPPPAAVRTEEFVNYFDYGYDGPEDGAFAIHLEGAPSRFGEIGEFDLRVGIQARRIRNEDRKTACLTFVVDVSGSMRPANRLPMVQEALRRLVDAMRGDDRVAIVAYSTRTQVVLPPTRLDRRDAILRAIDSLVAGGSTYAEAGLDLGYRVAIENFEDGAIHRVILLSDGLANVGRTGPDQILAVIRDRVEDGVTLTAIGVGMGSYNDAMLERLADAGDGTYHYVDRIEEAERLFVANLTGTLQTVARDAKVQVEFDPEVVSEFRLLGYENRRLAHEEFRNDSVDAGDVGAGHAATALYRVRFRDGAEGASATVRLRWQDPETGRIHELERTIDRRDVRTGFAEASPGLRLAVAVAEFADVLRGGPRTHPENLDVVADVARRLAPEFDAEASVVEFAGLVETARRLVGRGR